MFKSLDHEKVHRLGTKEKRRFSYLTSQLVSVIWRARPSGTTRTSTYCQAIWISPAGWHSGAGQTEAPCSSACSIYKVPRLCTEPACNTWGRISGRWSSSSPLECPQSHLSSLASGLSAIKNRNHGICPYLLVVKHWKHKIFEHIVNKFTVPSSVLRLYWDKIVWSPEFHLSDVAIPQHPMRWSNTDTSGHQSDQHFQNVSPFLWYNAKNIRLTLKK